MATLDPVAGYGAVLATLVAIWNFYQWWISGPKLVGCATPNMILVGDSFWNAQKTTYVSLIVSNRGNAETTITNVGIKAYDGLLQYMRGRSAIAAVINRETPGYTPPYKLAQGHEFRNLFDQTPELEDWSRKYRLYVCVWHSMSDRPVHVRLMPIEEKSQKVG